ARSVTILPPSRGERAEDARACSARSNRATEPDRRAAVGARRAPDERMSAGSIKPLYRELSARERPLLTQQALLEDREPDPRPRRFRSTRTPSSRAPSAVHCMTLLVQDLGVRISEDLTRDHEARLQGPR